MAVLLKEAAPVAEAANDGPGQAAEVLVPPFDVVTYAGPITVDGYERLSALLEAQRSNDNVLVVLETPGGDPHAAFRIARALGFHYRHVEALVPRYCKSAGTLVVIGASVLHIDDRGELGPLDVQVPRAHDFSTRGSALEFSGALDVLLPHQLRAFEASMQRLLARGLPMEAAANAASLMVGRLFRPIAEQVDPRQLVEMARAMAVSEAYGDRLAKKGRNIDAEGVRALARRYPSHGFSIDRKEAQQIFRDVRTPQGPISVVARRCRQWSATVGQALEPVVELHPSSFFYEEQRHEHANADKRVLGKPGTTWASHHRDVPGTLRHGPEDGGATDVGEQGEDAKSGDAVEPRLVAG